MPSDSSRFYMSSWLNGWSDIKNENIFVKIKIFKVVNANFEVAPMYSLRSYV